MSAFYAEGDLDKYLRNTFFPDYAYHGVLVEVGAADPDYLSVGKHFRENGWTIVSIEPNPDFCSRYHQKGLDVLQYACGNRDQDDVEFCVVNSEGAEYCGGKVTYESFSSLGLKQEFAALKGGIKHQSIRVKLRRLDSILKSHRPDISRIDVLAVDVEGWELEVIEGLSTSHWPIEVIVLENLFRKNSYLVEMRRRGYRLWKRMHPNDIYVKDARIKSFFTRIRIYLGEMATYARNR